MVTTRIVATVVLTAFLLLAAIACNDECGCRDYSPQTDEATRCRYHREAVWDYVEQGGDEVEMRSQLARMERLFDLLDDCRTWPCVTAEIEADSTAPGFALVFSGVQSALETKGLMAGNQWGKVALCGLQNGIRDWQDSLKTGGE